MSKLSITTPSMPTGTGHVNHIHHKTKNTNTGKCFRCNNTGHNAKDNCCPAKNSRKCNKTGHFGVVCKTKSSTEFSEPKSGKTSKSETHQQ